MRTNKQWVKPTLIQFNNTTIESGPSSGVAEQYRTLFNGVCVTFTSLGTSPVCGGATACPCS